MILVQHILDVARKRLAVLSEDAPLIDAAAILTNPNTPLAVVCDQQSIAVGVICSSDLVKVLATAKNDALGMHAGAIMSNPVVSCHVDDPQAESYSRLKSNPGSSITLPSPSLARTGCLIVDTCARK
jgi:CBS domain-containing protein